MKLLTTLLLTIFTLNLHAVTVKAIEFNGLVHISENVANRMLKFTAKENITTEQIDQAIKTFFKQGYFEDIWVRDEDDILTFYFIEKPIISKIEVKGYNGDDDADIHKTILNLEKGALYNKKRIEKAKENIIKTLNSEGKIDSVVEVTEEMQENGSVALTFTVNEGEEIIIESLKYSGLKGLRAKDFNSIIANKEHQWMGWFWGRNNGIMKLDQMQYDPLRIRDIYMQHGFLDAEVDTPFVRVDFDNYTSQMSYQIKEGGVYRVKSISISQAKHILEESALKADIDLELHETFNIKTFRDDAEVIKTKIANEGYAFVQVQPDLDKDEKNHTVDVNYRVIPGDKVYIRNVIISGNNRTLDRIVRRQVFLASGDLYNLTDLKDSRSALSRTGYFENTTVEEKRISKDLVDIIVKVSEAPTGNIQVGGGYGSYGGIMFSVGVNDRNIFGSGITMGVQLEKSERNSNYAFNISNPKLNDSDFSGNYSIYTSSNEYNDYTVDSVGTTLGTGHQFTRHWNGYLTYGYSDNAYNNIQTTSVTTDGYTINYDSYDKSSVSVSAAFNDTDDYYLPRNGVTFNQSIEKAGLGGTADFLKSTTKFGAYKGLEDYIDFDLILRYKARLFLAAETGYLPIGEKFYMGGLGSVRGYQSYSLSPEVENADGTKTRIGGKQTFSNSIEANIPFLPSAKMRLTGFFDWGMIGDEDISEIERAGYGIALEWFSPVGPVQLIFAKPLMEKPGDKTAGFEFTMGQRF
ncbi:MAG: outer membrane protein assembly factor BamA [Helicobacteraceae bacterium]|nr:outer membrane protein assembly factor BamA [Helicobacteraceae bacterium]